MSVTEEEEQDINYGVYYWTHYQVSLITHLLGETITILQENNMLIVIKIVFINWSEKTLSHKLEWYLVFFKKNLPNTKLYFGLSKIAKGNTMCV